MEYITNLPNNPQPPTRRKGLMWGFVALFILLGILLGIWVGVQAANQGVLTLSTSAQGLTKQDGNIKVRIRAVDAIKSSQALYIVDQTAKVENGQLKLRWQVPESAKKRAAYLEICVVDQNATRVSTSVKKSCIKNPSSDPGYNKVSCPYYVAANSTGVYGQLAGQNKLNDAQKVGCEDKPVFNQTSGIEKIVHEQTVIAEAGVDTPKDATTKPKEKEQEQEPKEDIIIEGGTYGDIAVDVVQFTVDQQGRITAIANRTLPVASTTETGILSSLDWTTFNGKENILAFNGNGLFSRSGGVVTGLGCLAGEIPKWIGTVFGCGADIDTDTDTGVTSVGSLDSQTKTASGATISGTTLSLQTADATNPGLVSTSAQTFAGAKTFNDALTVNSTALFQNSTNSTTAFQVRDASGGSLVLVDSTNASITLNGLNSASLTPWTGSSSMLTGRYNHTSVSANGYVYAIGGSTATTEYAKLNADGTLGPWTATTPTSSTRNGHTSVVANGYVYAIGGSTATTEYAKLNADGTLGPWTATTSMGTTRYRHASVVANGYIYAIGGSNVGGGVALATTEYAKLNADGTLGPWTATTSMGAVRNTLTSVVANGYVYAIGGQTANDNNSDATTEYAKLNADGTLGAWTASTSMSTPRNGHTSVVANGYVYAIGGIRDNWASNILATTEYAKLNADGTLGPWTATTSMGAVRTWHSSAVVNGYIYSIGGYNGPTLATTEYTSTARIKIGGTLDLVSLSGGSFADGGTGVGGELTAGNTNIIGSLQIAGNTSLAQGVSIDKELRVGGNLVVAGSTQLSGLNTSGNLVATGSTQLSGSLTATGTALFQNSSNSTTAFQIKDLAGKSLFTVDTVNTGITINGDNSSALTPWTTSSSMGSARYGHGSVVANGYVYATGGHNGTVAVATTERTKLNADGTLGAWTATTSMGATRQYHGSVTANGYVYAIGGHNGTNSINTTERAKLNADGTLGAWTATSPMNTTRTGAGVVVANGYVYAVGGHSNGTLLNTTEYAKLNADGTLGAWTTAAPTMGVARNDPGVVVANGYVYALGGWNSNVGGYLATTEYAKLNADGTLGAWTATTPMAITRASMGKVVANGYVYVIGGYGAGAYQSTVYYAKLNANGTLGAWTASTSMGSARNSPGSVIANGYVYAIGGHNGTTAVATTEYTSTARTKIGGALDLVSLGSQTLADGQTGTGGELTAGNTNIIGGLQVQGSATFAQSLSIDKELRVGGNILFLNSIDSTTALQVQNAAGTTSVLTVDTIGGIVNVVSLVASGGLTVNGHIITGGNTPATVVNANAGGGATCVVGGNDTSGTITITTGSGGWLAGAQCDITFALVFGSAPRSVITPTSNNSNSVAPYVSSTTTTMTINFANPATGAATYSFSYFNPQ